MLPRYHVFSDSVIKIGHIVCISENIQDSFLLLPAYNQQGFSVTKFKGGLTVVDCTPPHIKLLLPCRV